MDGAWSENAFTVKANILHQRVDGGGMLDSGKGVKTFGDVTVYDEQLGIYGKVDCLELLDCNGVSSVRIIEYKPTMPDGGSSVSDRIQVYAQYRCVRNLFDGEVSAYVYYSDVRRRIKVEFDDEDEKLLLSTIKNIEESARNKVMPSPLKNERCNGCSLEDKCMPSVSGGKVKKMILEEDR